MGPDLDVRQCHGQGQWWLTYSSIHVFEAGETEYPLRLWGNPDRPENPNRKAQSPGQNPEPSCLMLAKHVALKTKLIESIMLRQLEYLLLVV